MAKAIRKTAVRKTTNARNRNTAVTIDFGIGGINVEILPNSSVTVNEFIQAIKEAALIVPLPKLTACISKHNRF
jgi:hypothetical protein